METNFPARPLPARTVDYTRLREEAAEASEYAAQRTYTIDDAIEAGGLGRFQYVLLALTGLCWTAESMEMLLLSFIKAPLQCQWGISDASAAAITTCVGVGMLLGAIAWGVLADSYGRRIAFITSTLFTFVFGFISAISINYAMILVSRGLVGFGIGGVPVAFSLLMEFLPAANRGSWGMGLAIFWSLGAIFESLVAMLVVPKLGWRWLIGLSTIPLGLVLAMSFWVSESARWLVSKGRVDEAQLVVERVSRVNGRPLPVGRLRQEMPAELEEGAESPRKHQSGLFRPGARSLAFKLWYLWFAAAFLYYGLVMLQPELISKENVGERCRYAEHECGALSTETSCTDNQICAWGAGASQGLANCRPSGAAQEGGEASACARQLTREDFMSALWSSSGELPGIIVAFAVIDVIGRRPLMGYTYGLTAACFVVLLACIGRTSETVVFFVARAVSTGAFQGIYLFTNEIYPSKVRASAMGISSSIARVGLILTPFVAQYFENVNHAAAMWLYFTISGLCILVISLVPIETTHRPLLNSMEELVATLRAGPVLQNEDPGIVTFAKDPSVPGIVRFFRWRARVDGEVSS